MFLVKSRKSLLRLQILIQRQRMLPVDIDLPIVRECDSEVGITECSDLLVGSRRLMFKLVAREIQNLKSLWTVLLVNALQLIVLRRKSAFGRRVDYQDNLSLSSVLLLLHTSFYPCFQFRLRHKSDILADHLAVL